MNVADRHPDTNPQAKCVHFAPWRSLGDTIKRHGNEVNKAILHFLMTTTVTHEEALEDLKRSLRESSARRSSEGVLGYLGKHQLVYSSLLLAHPRKRTIDKGFLQALVKNTDSHKERHEPREESKHKERSRHKDKSRHKEKRRKRSRGDDSEEERYRRHKKKSVDKKMKEKQEDFGPVIPEQLHKTAQDAIQTKMALDVAVKGRGRVGSNVLDTLFDAP